MGTDGEHRCAAVNCELKAPADRPFCGRHWARIKPATKAAWRRDALRKGEDYLPPNREKRARRLIMAMHAELDAQRVGTFDTSRCRYCGETIAWMLSAAGRWFPVELDGIEPEDNAFVPSRHQFHSENCPGGAS